MEQDSRRRNIDFNDVLRVNHYRLISESYYKNNKCVRGGGRKTHGRKMSKKRGTRKRSYRKRR